MKKRFIIEKFKLIWLESNWKTQSMFRYFILKKFCFIQRIIFFHNNQLNYLFNHIYLESCVCMSYDYVTSCKETKSSYGWNPQSWILQKLFAALWHLTYCTVRLSSAFGQSLFLPPLLRPLPSEPGIRPCSDLWIVHPFAY